MLANTLTSKVSIRTPRAGRDVGDMSAAVQNSIVSIRTPRAGRDIIKNGIGTTNFLFLSARPGQGATYPQRRP